MTEANYTLDELISMPDDKIRHLITESTNELRMLDRHSTVIAAAAADHRALVDEWRRRDREKRRLTCTPE